MPNYLLAYHGGTAPQSPEEGAKAMAAWNAWFAAIGANVVDGGNPVGVSSTVSADGVSGNGGANPVSGYSIVSADDMAGAIEMSKACPIVLNHGGSVEVAEIMPID